MNKQLPKILQGVERSEYAIKERTLRFPFKKFELSSVKDQLVRFIHSSKIKKVEIFVTANIVLVDQIKKQYR